MRVFGLTSKFLNFSQVLYRGIRTRLCKSRTLHIAVRWAPIDKNRKLTVKKDFGLKNGFSVESMAGLDEMADKWLVFNRYWGLKRFARPQK